jgi:TctA family transporter
MDGFIGELIFVLGGFVAGTVAGLLPGIGVLASLIAVFPLLLGASPTELILFYMALAATVQYVGTVPSVFVGIPGETNSAPAVLEGEKFARHKNSDIAVGICALGSILGSIVAVGIFWLISGFALDVFGTVVSTRFKSIVFVLVILSFVLFFNKKHRWINVLFVAMGIWLGMIGSNPVTEEFRYTLGTKDLRLGLGIIPMVLGMIVIPSLIRKGYNYQVQLDGIKPTFKRPFFAFLRNWTSSVRGSVLGFVCGLVPGVTTILGTTVSHTVENRLHKNKPVRKIISAETANNSAQFASLIPLLMFGIPITGSEVFLYHMLLDAGWTPSRLDELSNNVTMILTGVLPWFVVVNVLGLMVSWPLAKQAMFVYRLKYNTLVGMVLMVMLIVTLWVGYEEGRMVSYVCQTAFASVLGLVFHRFNLLPMFVAFVLSNDIEAVAVREFLFAKISLGM